MDRFLHLFTIGVFLSVLTTAFAWDYPEAKKGDVSDDFFGKQVADPYRWMEEDSPELSVWISKENQLTRSVLDTLPGRDELRRELTARWNYEKHSLPFKKGGHYFYFKNTGLQNQSVLYKTDSLEKQGDVLLDPNEMSADGTISLSSMTVSKNGKYLAYTISQSGSDWEEGHVLDTATGNVLPDKLQWLKFTDLAWAGDGFYYSRYPEPEEGKELSNKNEFHQVWYHKVGTEQSDDTLIYINRDQPLRLAFSQTDDAEEYLFLTETESTYGNSLMFKRITDLENPDIVWTTIFPTFEAETSPIAVRNGRIFALTDYQAPKKRLVAIDPANPSPENWVDILPEGEDLLVDVTPTGNRLAVVYLHDAAHEVSFFDYTGKRLEDIKLPTLGVVSLSGKMDDSELFWNFTSFTYPSVIYRYDNENHETTQVFEAAQSIQSDDYITDRVFYTSKDGTRAPLFLTYKKGMKKNQPRPTILYGYGGFNINMTPRFKPDWTVWLDHGGILAVAVLRGGGEYGEDWHKAGTKCQKQNVFDDYTAAAEYLIKEQYASPDTLAILGGSNGGLLVGAVMTQRPDLFRVAVPMVGVLDMLRYHLFTIGWAWAVDYGKSDDSEEMFQYLYSYSPLHNVKKGVNYPAVLLMTSDHDDRVVPAHSFKFAAALQAADGGKNPILIRIETDAGHGHGKPISKSIEEAVDLYSFILNSIPESDR